MKAELSDYEISQAISILTIYHDEIYVIAAVKDLLRRHSQECRRVVPSFESYDVCSERTPELDDTKPYKPVSISD